MSPWRRSCFYERALLHQGQGRGAVLRRRTRTHRRCRTAGAATGAARCKTDRQTARGPDRKRARQQDSKQDCKTDRQPPAWPEETVRQLRDALREEHPVHNTFRYSRRDLDRLRDIVYELEVKRRLKTSRNDVMRLALVWIIDDYRERGPDSLLVAALRDDARRPGP